MKPVTKKILITSVLVLVAAVAAFAVIKKKPGKDETDYGNCEASTS